MADWVVAAERVYVAAAVGRATGDSSAAGASAAGAEPAAAAEPAGLPADAGLTAGAAPASALAPRVLLRSGWRADLAAPDRRAHALAAAGAVASHHLAVGTPRSFGIVIDDVTEVAAAALSLIAHRAWFAPRDLRCASMASGAAELAAATSGRAVSLDEALACDIVNIYTPRILIAPAQLRRGTHVNAIAASVLDPELLVLATVVPEAGLPALAAGLVDGRQLDELTIFLLSDAPTAVSKIDIRQVP